MRLRFVTSTPLEIQRGSGTFVGIATLARALENLGVTIDVATPSIHLPVYTAERILFNESLRFRRAAPVDATIGFDMDGYSIAGGNANHVASIKGVIADELQFESGFTRATMAIQARFERMHLRRAARVMTTSRYAALRIKQLYGVAHAQIVPELIDVTQWRRLMQANAASPEPGAFTVLSVCRHYPRKRLDLLLRAAARLRTRIPQLRVRIVGDGPEHDRLRALWRDRRLNDTVEFLGDVSREQLAVEYQRCDVFCLPSVQEGFGIVFLEAMAAGKPIVAARAAAVPEVVQHGVLVEPESEGALADGILSLFEDDRLRRELCSAGLDSVQQYDAPRIASQFLAALEPD